MGQTPIRVCFLNISLLNRRYKMRRIDFTPLHRFTVGFDRIQRQFDQALNMDESQLSYPPYNIEATTNKNDEDSYLITMAVAGFAENELSIFVKEDTLVISGKMQKHKENPSYLHRGIAGGPFERRFELADHIKVTSARLENGLLHIDLVREIPEEKKPRQKKNFGKKKTKKKKKKKKKS